MECYFNNDIVNTILTFLNKTDSFNFIDTTKLLDRKPLYGKYLFFHSEITNKEICHYIKHCQMGKINKVNMYPNLQSLIITETYLDQPLNHLPKTLKSLEIYDNQWSQPVDCLPCALETLKITGKKFNKNG